MPPLTLVLYPLLMPKSTPGLVSLNQAPSLAREPSPPHGKRSFPMPAGFRFLLQDKGLYGLGIRNTLHSDFVSFGAGRGD